MHSPCLQACCRVLQGGAGWCRVVQGGAGCCRMLQGDAGWCRVLQGVAGCCRVLQGGASCIWHIRNNIGAIAMPTSAAMGVLVCRPALGGLWYIYPPKSPQYTRQRALYSRKRAIKSRERALHIRRDDWYMCIEIEESFMMALLSTRKRALDVHKRALYICERDTNFCESATHPQRQLTFWCAGNLWESTCICLQNIPTYLQKSTFDIRKRAL